MAEQNKQAKKMRAQEKKKIARLTVEQRARLAHMRERKEVGYFLTPDAPQCKKRSFRKVSPVRVPCPLLPGTTEVPPPHKPQKWEIEKAAQELASRASGPSRVNLEEDATTPPPPIVQDFNFKLTSDIVRLDEGQEVDPNLLVDASVELIGFSPSSSSPAKRSKKKLLQNYFPGPSSSTTTRPEPSIFDDDLDEEILQWERSVGLDSGSEFEDDDDPSGVGPHRRHAAEYAVEDLPSELSELLQFMDREEDRALREAAEEDLLRFDWSHDPEVFTGVREVFTETTGPTFHTAGMSPFQIFSKIWDEDIINLIVEETNKYAAFHLAKETLPKNSRLRKWNPLTPQELWTFFGVLMLHSIYPIPVEKEYWKACLPYLQLTNFGDIMPINRFALIKRCLHFVDNMVCARGISKKLMRIKPIIDHLNKKFSSLYLPEQEVAIDESLMLWKGRLSFSQVIANKAARVGIKSYELCESSTGYLWQMIIYSGKKERHNVAAQTNEGEPEGATSRIVLDLIRPLLNKGHTLVMDNFYNSPLLARILKAQKTDVMGTMRLNREFVPDSLRQKNKTNMRPGEVAFSQTRDLTIAVWKDSSNVVSLISTYHKTEVGGKEKYGDFRYKPKVVLDYNLSMGGVDKKDQFLQAFPIERVRNPKWYKKLFRRLLNVSVHNAFVMSLKTVKTTQRQFRVTLADEIIKTFRPPKIQTPPAITGTHFPAKTNRRKSRCKWCALKKIDTCTVYKCESCNVNLCIIGCFKEFHLSQGKDK